MLDAGITRTSLLWGPHSFEDTGDIRRATFAQTYQAARAVYSPGPTPENEVLVLGNSRIWLAARPSFLQPALDAEGVSATVRNLGIFGAGTGDLETFSRHLVHRPGRLVVVAVGTGDLVDTPMTPLAGIPSELLSYGWEPATAGRETPLARIDRWARTLWPLYRFRCPHRPRSSSGCRPTALPIGNSICW